MVSELGIEQKCPQFLAQLVNRERLTNRGRLSELLLGGVVRHTFERPDFPLVELAIG